MQHVNIYPSWYSHHGHFGQKIYFWLSMKRVFHWHALTHMQTFLMCPTNTSSQRSGCEVLQNFLENIRKMYHAKLELTKINYFTVFVSSNTRDSLRIREVKSKTVRMCKTYHKIWLLKFQCGYVIMNGRLSRVLWHFLLSHISNC